MIPFPILTQSGRLVGPAHHVGASAEDGLAPQAELAVAAEDGQAHNYGVPRLQVINLLAHRLHRAGGLVAQDGRLGDAVASLHVMKVAVADAAGPGADEHLPGTRGIHLDLFHLQGYVYLAQNGSFHSRTSLF